MYWRLCKLALARVKSSVDYRLQIMSMGQKTPLPNITDFLTSSSREDRECTKERSTMAHRHQNEVNIAKPSTRAEFPWVSYVAPAQENRPSMLCTLGHESSKRKVWLTILCKLLRKTSCLSTSGHSASRRSISRSYGYCCQALWWYFRLCRGVSLFATVRGTFKCLYWLARGRAPV